MGLTLDGDRQTWNVVGNWRLCELWACMLCKCAMCSDTEQQQNSSVCWARRGWLWRSPVWRLCWWQCRRITGQHRQRRTALSCIFLLGRLGFQSRPQPTLRQLHLLAARAFSALFTFLLSAFIFTKDCFFLHTLMTLWVFYHIGLFLVFHQVFIYFISSGRLDWLSFAVEHVLCMYWTTDACCYYSYYCLTAIFQCEPGYANFSWVLQFLHLSTD